jgi:hypothetical protein
MSTFIELVFKELTVCSRIGQDVHYEVLLNQTKKSRTSTSEVMQIRAHPDLMITDVGCTLMIGKNKWSGIRLGVEDFVKKVGSLLQTHYGLMNFMIGYVAAGNTWQWLYLSKNGKHTEVGRHLDFYMPIDQYELLLSLTCAYELLGTMSKRVPKLARRILLFVPDKTVADRTITFLGDSVEKVLYNFSAFCVRKAVDLECIEATYAVIEDFAREHPNR